MSRIAFSLCVLSASFLFSDSSIGYYLENDEEEYYEEERDRPLSQNEQKRSMNSSSNQMSNDDGMMMSPNCCPEIVEDCCYCNVCPPTEMITPLGGPCVNCGLGYYLTADFTYWSAREQGLGLATITGFQTFGLPTLGKIPTGKVIRPKTKWEPGFKVGAGIDFCHDGWDVFLQYTWFRQNDTSVTKTQNGTPNPTTPLETEMSKTGRTLYDNIWGVDGIIQFMNPSLGNVDITDTPLVVQVPIFQTVSGNWKLHFNVVDLELGRNFYISRRITLRPHFGLKGMWEKQKLTLSFTNPVLVDQLFVFTPTDSGAMNNKFTSWAAGTCAGINTAWHITRSFSLLGDIAVSGLWQHVSVKRMDQESFDFNSTNSRFSITNVKDTYSLFTPVLETLLGLRFECWTEEATYHFGLDAGWESQIWFFQNQFYRVFSAEESNGTLGFQGLTVKARFDF